MGVMGLLGCRSTLGMVGVSLVILWGHLGILRMAFRLFWAILKLLGIPFRSFWNCLCGFLGSLGIRLVAVWWLGGPLGIPGGSWGLPERLGGDFRDLPGNYGRPFGSILNKF